MIRSRSFSSMLLMMLMMLILAATAACAPSQSQAQVPDGQRLQAAPEAPVAAHGTFVLEGTPSPFQQHNSAILVACGQDPNTTPSAALLRSCRKKIAVPLNEALSLSAGSYLLAFENSFYPGFVRIVANQTRKVVLQQIQLPTGFGANARFIAYRDLARLAEQQKIYFAEYFTGNPMFPAPLRSENASDLYPFRSRTANQSPATAAQECIARIKEPTAKAQRLCRSASAGHFLAMSEFFDFGSSHKEAKRAIPGSVSIVPITDATVVVKTLAPAGFVKESPETRLLIAPEAPVAPGFINALPGYYKIQVIENGKPISVFPVDALSNVRDGQGRGPVSDYGRMPNAASLGTLFNAIAKNAKVPSQLSDEEGDVPVERGLNSCFDPRIKMWKTAWRAYCRSDKDEGCERKADQFCEPMYNIR